jgi:hypothetical protein
MSDSPTPEFFHELDQLLGRYPQYAREILDQHFPVPSFQVFHSSIRSFFADRRSNEACHAIARFIIHPFITALTSCANRLVSEALLDVVKSIPEIFMDEVVRPIVFDQNSRVYQFELLQRLLTEPIFSERALVAVFAGRSPSLEAPMKHDACSFLRSAIQASPPLADADLAHIMLHLRTQIAHNPDETSPLFMLLLGKHAESLQPEAGRDRLRQTALSIVECLSSRLQTVANRLLKCET